MLGDKVDLATEGVAVVETRGVAAGREDLEWECEWDAFQVEGVAVVAMRNMVIGMENGCVSNDNQSVNNSVFKSGGGS